MALSNRSIVFRKLVSATAFLILLCAPHFARALDGGYRLGPEDKISLKVVEWRPSQDRVFEWKALNDVFIVSAGGTLSIPLVGEVAAQGQTPADVAQVISQKLKERMNLAALPDTSINVIQYRPFFVSGDVTKPGPYPFQPGVTVLQAVAVAGGAPRPGDLGLVRLGREVIDGQGDLADLKRQLDALQVRKARLEAELDGAATFVAPPGLSGRKSDPVVAQIVSNEAMIFDARQRALQTQSKLLSDLKVFFTQEGESVKAQLDTLDTQMRLINKELASVTTLVEKGMVVAPRQLALERSVAQIQGDRLGMQTSFLRVQEEISKTDIALVELNNTRSTEGSIELRDTQVKIDELVTRIDTRKRLLYEAQVTAPQIVAGRLRQEKLQPSYSIVRHVEGGVVEVSASESSEVEPGDTVKVTLPLPDPMIEDPDAATADSAPAVPDVAVR